MPDLFAGDTALAPETASFLHQLGEDVRRFRDAVTDYALNVKRADSTLAPDFAVTDAMLDDLWNRMRQRGIDIARIEYDAAAPYVRRTLAYEIARYVLGPEAEFRRRAGDDPVIAAALRVIAGSRDAADVVQRAESMGSAEEKQLLRE